MVPATSSLVSPPRRERLRAAWTPLTSASREPDTATNCLAVSAERDFRTGRSPRDDQMAGRPCLSGPLPEGTHSHVRCQEQSAARSSPSGDVAAGAKREARTGRLARADHVIQIPELEERRDPQDAWSRATRHTASKRQSLSGIALNDRVFSSLSLLSGADRRGGAGRRGRARRGTPNLARARARARGATTCAPDPRPLRTGWLARRPAN